jgi:pimeloyl-ACP methyl ester carboxylesterase
LLFAYVAWFQIPVLPELILLAGGGTVLRGMLRRSGLDAGRADAYVRRQLEPGALTASLGWYRALPLSSSLPGVVTVPARYMWSSGDSALGRRAAELTGEYVTGSYVFEVVEGASHWLPESYRGRVASSILDHVDGTSG